MQNRKHRKRNFLDIHKRAENLFTARIQVGIMTACLIIARLIKQALLTLIEKHGQHVPGDLHLIIVVHVSLFKNGVNFHSFCH